MNYNQRVDFLARQSVAESSPEGLRSIMKERGRNDERLRAGYEEEQRLNESVNRAKQAMEHARGTPQEQEITALCEKYEQELESFSRNYQILQAEDRALSNRQTDEQAYVVQEEVLSFVLSKRYAFTSLNLANAMAGLPFMKWRQSSKRCGKMAYRISKSTLYRLFEIVYRANRSSSSPQDLLNAVRTRLQNSRCKAKICNKIAGCGLDSGC